MTQQPPQLDLFDSAFIADPYPTYARLRSTAPAYRTTLHDGAGVWLVIRYDEVLRVLKDERFVKDWRNALTPEQIAQLPPMSEVMKPFSRNILHTDPPDHQRLRALVSKAFSPRLTEQMRRRVQEIADTLLDAVQDKGEMDLINDYAFPLPITVIAKLLGIPAQDWYRFRRLSEAVMPENGIQQYVEKNHILITRLLTDYLCAMFEQKRKNQEDDLISVLVTAEEAGDKLSEDELLGMVTLLLSAGQETITNLIGNGMLALLEHPDQLQELRNNPLLIKSAVEEMLRYDGPMKTATKRFAREDVAIEQVIIPRGEMILAVIAAAHRDPARFPDPDRFDITRQDNQHLAFSKGIHYCVGASLARMEGQIAINTLLHRLPNLRLKYPLESPAWRPALIARGLKRLPVEF